MKKQLVFFCLCFMLVKGIAQNEKKEDAFMFHITDYFVALSDSVTLVQVQLPANANIVIKEKQMGILRHNFTNEKYDTAAVGWGRCQLIKGEYYYFGMNLYNKAIKPKANDLLYTIIDYPAAFKGKIYNLIKHGIYFTRVTEEVFYDFNTATGLNEKTENSLIDSLVADIRYTGMEMLKQMPEQDIKGGIFDGKKLFASMQIVTAVNVKDFLNYVAARPNKYAGNKWKISETFATWMVSSTPTVIKE